MSQRVVVDGTALGGSVEAKEARELYFVEGELTKQSTWYGLVDEAVEQKIQVKSFGDKTVHRNVDNWHVWLKVKGASKSCPCQDWKRGASRALFIQKVGKWASRWLGERDQEFGFSDWVAMHRAALPPMHWLHSEYLRGGPCDEDAGQ